jgi:branched-subunit amino acid ABC-type transport system permease component
MSINEDKLRNLFRQLKASEPSTGFEDRLMLKIARSIKVRNRSKKILTTIAVLGCIAGLLISVRFLFSYFDIQLEAPQWSDFWASFKFELPVVELPSLLVVMLAVVVLLLLVTDMLIWRHRFNKKMKA